MRRLAVAIALVLLVGLTPGASSSVGHFPAAAAEHPQSDFNGDGFADLAVGVPDESLGSITQAGAVDVLYGTAAGLTGSGKQILTQNSLGVGGTAEMSDEFGSALAVGDFDNNGFADLAVGTPAESVGSVVALGVVNVLYGGAGGVTGSGSQTFTQNSAGVGDTGEAGDHFGDALAVGYFNDDGFADLAIGVPFESSTDVLDPGAVNVLYGSAAGLSGPGSQYFTQNSAGVGDTSEAEDHFGDALGSGDFDNDGFGDLAVGVPHEFVGTSPAAGGVNVLYGGTGGLTGSGSQFFTQATPGVGSAVGSYESFGDALAADDFDRDGFAELVVGVPNESGGGTYGGAVNVLSGSAAGLTGSGSRFFTQDTPGVGNSAEASDFFGEALATGDFDRDGFADLAVGVRFEDVGTIRDAGGVNGLYGSVTGLTGAGSQFFTQNTAGVASTAEADDFFGFGLAAGDFDGNGFADLAVSAAGENVGGHIVAGAVSALDGSVAGLTGAGSQFITQNTPGVGSTAEDGDVFGFALAASGP